MSADKHRWEQRKHLPTEMESDCIVFLHDFFLCNLLHFVGGCRPQFFRTLIIGRGEINRAVFAPETEPHPKCPGSEDAEDRSVCGGWLLSGILCGGKVVEIPSNTVQRRALEKENGENGRAIGNPGNLPAAVAYSPGLQALLIHEPRACTNAKVTRHSHNVLPDRHAQGHGWKEKDQRNEGKELGVVNSCSGRPSYSAGGRSESEGQKLKGLSEVADQLPAQSGILLRFNEFICHGKTNNFGMRPMSNKIVTAGRTQFEEG